MISRVYYYNFLLRALVQVLPFFAFGMAAYIRFGNVWIRHGRSVVPQYYLVLLAFTEFVWLLAAHYYKLSSVADLFWEYTGIRAAFFACFATLLLQAALLVFVRPLIVSRIFILLSNAILFLSVVATRNFFRLTSASSNWPRKCERILVVGTDQYARRSVKLLRRIPFFRCEIQAYLQLPGQPVLVQDAPVISTMEPLHLEALSFDEIVVAIPAKHYLQVASVLDSLQRFREARPRHLGPRPATGGTRKVVSGWPVADDESGPFSRGKLCLHRAEKDF